MRYIEHLYKGNVVRSIFEDRNLWFLHSHLIENSVYIFTIEHDDVIYTRIDSK